ncbi:MAG: response regulator transcription factor [Defluviitaleaceae bacterium]|nr:response regulator transcription factor [Defluviitaleaceae bacterium]
MNSIIYVADDDAVNLRMVQAILEREGLHVECFESGDLLYEAFLRKKCNLVILDVLMPGNDGFTVGAKIRQISNLPIIVLTGQESDDDYIFGISLGLDVYLTKPFNPAKLVAHVRTLLIKAELGNPQQLIQPEDKPAIITYADITIDTNKLTAQCSNSKLQLTHTELNLLTYMFRNQNKAVSRDELLNAVWGYNSVVGSRAIDDAIKRLRKKLTDAKTRVSIDTVRGFGFRVSES